MLLNVELSETSALCCGDRKPRPVALWGMFLLLILTIAWEGTLSPLAAEAGTQKPKVSPKIKSSILTFKLPEDNYAGHDISPTSLIYIYGNLVLDDRGLKVPQQEDRLRAKIRAQVQATGVLPMSELLLLAKLFEQHNDDIEAANCLLLCREVAKLDKSQGKMLPDIDQKLKLVRARIDNSRFANFDQWNPNVPVYSRPTTTAPLAPPGFNTLMVTMGRLTDPMKQVPNMGNFWLDRGKLYMRYGMYANAANDFNTAKTKLGRDDMRPWINLAICYFNMADIQQTLWCAQGILAIDKNSAEGHGAKALGLVDRPERAIEECNTAIKLNPKVDWFYVTRAQIYEDRMSNWKNAIGDCTKALQLAPDNPAARLYRARAYNAVGRYQDAIKDLTAIVSKEPLYYEAYRTRAEAYSSSGQDDLAKKDQGDYDRYRKWLHDALAKGR
jgi:Putative Zn-dependent protease, contains TPR repeats